MAISLIPNKKSKGVISSGIFSDIKSYVLDFLPALAVLGIVIVLYLVTSVWFSNLKSQYDEIQDEKDSLLNITRDAQAGDIKDFVSRARALKTVVEEHIQASEIFRPFEESVHRQVTITSMELKSSDKLLTVRGTAPGFETLGEQFIIWKENSISFNSATLETFQREEEGNITFQMDFEVKEDYLK